MSIATGHRIRWFAIWILVGFWFVGLAFRWLGDWLHAVLALAIVLVVYELLAPEPAAAATKPLLAHEDREVKALGLRQER